MKTKSYVDFGRRGIAGLDEDEELRGLDADEELQGFAEDEELRGVGEDQDMQGIDGYVRQDGMSGLEAYRAAGASADALACGTRPGARGMETTVVSRVTRFPIPHLRYAAPLF